MARDKSYKTQLLSNNQNAHYNKTKGKTQIFTVSLIINNKSTKYNHFNWKKFFGNKKIEK